MDRELRNRKSPAVVRGPQIREEQLEQARITQFGRFCDGFASHVWMAARPSPVIVKRRRRRYQSVGSGAGIKQIKAKTVDFGASDMPLKDEELAKDGPDAVPHRHRRRGAGGQHPGHRARASSSSPAQVLGDIYLGKITKWNDPAIAALNPGVQAARRGDRRRCAAPTARAPRFIFTNYLSKVNPEWKTKVGEGTAVNWPTGAGGKGNEGVAAYVQRLPNSIGYVEYAYAKQNKMAHALLQNKAGKFVAPDDDDLQGRRRRRRLDARRFYQVLTDQPGKDAWPITGATFILMHKAQDKPAQAAEVAEVLRLGLQERRQDGRRPRLRADARRR